MSDWIEINLPWSNYFHWDMNQPDYPKMPNLDNRVKEVFGTTIQEEHNKISRKEHSRYVTARLELIKKLGNKYDTMSQNTCERKLEETGIPAVLKVLSYHKLRRKIEDWHKDQPEMIAWEQDKKRWREEQTQKSFTGRGLNKPGTLVEVLDGDVTKQLLIGHINPFALEGVCEDCGEFSSTLIVKRYKIIWTQL